MAFILQRREQETTFVKIRGKISIVPKKSKVWLKMKQNVPQRTGTQQTGFGGNPDLKKERFCADR